MYFNAEAKETKIDTAIFGYTETKDGNFNYYIKGYQNRLYDPFNLSERDKLLNWKFIKVTEEVYEYYLYFIQFKSVKFKQYAERALTCL